MIDWVFPKEEQGYYRLEEATKKDQEPVKVSYSAIPPVPPEVDVKPVTYVVDVLPFPSLEKKKGKTPKKQGKAKKNSKSLRK